MTALDPSFLAAVAVTLAMAAFTAALGVYLLRTNPPKDESRFVGLGEEKMDEEELAEWEAEMERRREKR
ncbi:MAG: hypothetical protein ABEJ22_06950 [Haloferacaceae archaeon]